jgi:hypothetical protein
MYVSLVTHVVVSKNYSIKVENNAFYRKTFATNFNYTFRFCLSANSYYQHVMMVT